jgi:hypothetical protein
LRRVRQASSHLRLASAHRRATDTEGSGRLFQRCAQQGRQQHCLSATQVLDRLRLHSEPLGVLDKLCIR